MESEKAKKGRVAGRWVLNLITIATATYVGLTYHEHPLIALVLFFIAGTLSVLSAIID
jgi:hypothetical protein